ncbi:MAG TPA: hypothetical protein VMW53_12950 [archaeon]|nr:hypothetical protein [archaeon]
MSGVTIVLQKGDPWEGGHLGNGAVGGSTLLDGLGVFESPDELDVVFVDFLIWRGNNECHESIESAISDAIRNHVG